MIYVYTKEQAEEIAQMKRAKEQAELAKQGISSAIEGGQTVTIGNADCDYTSFKEFILAYIFKYGVKAYLAKTDWFENELIEDLAELDPNDDLWKEDIVNYFGGVEA